MAGFRDYSADLRTSTDVFQRASGEWTGKGSHVTENINSLTKSLPRAHACWRKERGKGY